MAWSLTPQVRMALLRFLEALGQCDYLSLPGGSVIINYSLKLSQWDSSVSRAGPEGT